MRSPRIDPVGLAGGVVLPLLASGLILALAAVWEPRLPDPIAQHWGVGGAPNQFGDLWPNTWRMAMLVVAVGGGCGFVAMLSRSLLMLRQILLVIGLTMTGALAALWISALAAQLDLTDAADARLAEWPPALFGILGFVTGFVLARRLTDGRLRTAATERPPANLPRRAVVPLSETVTSPMWLQIVLVAPLAALAVLLTVASRTAWPLLLIGSVGLLVFTMLRARIDVDGTGLRATVTGMTAFALTINEIAKAEVTTVSPGKQYGGYGLRMRGKGHYGLILRRGPAVAVTTAAGQVFTLTTPRAEEIAGVLNTAADQSRP